MTQLDDIAAGMHGSRAGMSMRQLADHLGAPLVLDDRMPRDQVALVNENDAVVIELTPASAISEWERRCALSQARADERRATPHLWPRRRELLAVVVSALVLGVLAWLFVLVFWLAA